MGESACLVGSRKRRKKVIIRTTTTTTTSKFKLCASPVCLCFHVVRSADVYEVLRKFLCPPTAAGIIPPPAMPEFIFVVREGAAVPSSSTFGSKWYFIRTPDTINRSLLLFHLYSSTPGSLEFFPRFPLRQGSPCSFFLSRSFTETAVNIPRHG